MGEVNEAKEVVEEKEVNEEKEVIDEKELDEKLLKPKEKETKGLRDKNESIRIERHQDEGKVSEKEVPECSEKIQDCTDQQHLENVKVIKNKPKEKNEIPEEAKLTVKESICSELKRQHDGENVKTKKKKSHATQTDL